MDAPLIDTRPEHDFVRGHAPGAAGFPLEELPHRTHELPPAHRPLRLTDDDPQRAERAARFLRARGHAVHVEPCPPELRTESGPSQARLWRPSPLLPLALDLIARHGPAPHRRALDVACGTGRDAVFLALAGYDVDAIDVLDDALARARDLARRNGVALRTIRQDLERGPVPALPPCAYAFVTVFRYLHRPLLPALADAIAPGGYLVYETFHERNLATGRPPRRADHLLRDGELPTAFPAFEVLHHAQAVERDGRFFTQFVARRPATRNTLQTTGVDLQERRTVR